MQSVVPRGLRWILGQEIERHRWHSTCILVRAKGNSSRGFCYKISHTTWQYTVSFLLFRLMVKTCWFEKLYTFNIIWVGNMLIDSSIVHCFLPTTYPSLHKRETSHVHKKIQSLPPLYTGLFKPRKKGCSLSVDRSLYNSDRLFYC